MIDISAYMTSIHPNKWLNICQMLSKTGLSFELVIVGPNKPNFELPKEIKFYCSHVKPQQCMHTAAIMSIGKTLLQIVDDIEYQDGGIEAMFNEVISNERVTATCHYHKNNIDATEEQNIFGIKTDFAPLLPVCGLYKRSVYSEVGGLDKRFNGIMGELDLYMRIFNAGYHTKFVNYRCNENRGESSLLNRFWYRDRSVFMNLWDSTTMRNDIVRTYNNENLLTVEQNYP